MVKHQPGTILDLSQAISTPRNINRSLITTQHTCPDLLNLQAILDISSKATSHLLLPLDQLLLTHMRISHIHLNTVIIRHSSMPLGSCIKSLQT